MQKLLDEKDDHVTHLQERVTTLEQRVRNTDLDDDERHEALKAEVDVTVRIVAPYIFGQSHLNSAL